MTLAHPRAVRGPKEELAVAPLFSLEGTSIPRRALPQGELSPDVAYQIVHDELMLDGNARMNVATFVSTWMEPQAEKLMAECFDKNMIDKDEYPQTAELESRCVREPDRPRRAAYRREAGLSARSDGPARRGLAEAAAAA